MEEIINIPLNQAKVRILTQLAKPRLKVASETIISELNKAYPNKTLIDAMRETEQELFEIIELLNNT